MELWIRSQDRESIFKVKSVFYTINEENEHLIRTIVIDNVDNGIVRIGQYKTKERALEVLDEIQRHITKHNETVVIRICNEDFIKQNPVYEMPKE